MRGRTSGDIWSLLFRGMASIHPIRPTDPRAHPNKTYHFSIENPSNPVTFLPRTVPKSERPRPTPPRSSPR